ncbi:MAG TPA: response regulator [Gammaproteobacteria bacterium]|nr:response regulator [Gammaproteobacteria bacterium]
MGLPTILLVEDDSNDEELGRLALEANSIKCDLVIAHDGPQALDYLWARGGYAMREAGILPKVVLLDLKLPKLSGIEVLRQIRDHPRTRHLPVVIFTSSKEESDLIECYRLGANAYVQKPIDFAEFSAALQQIGIFWLIANRTLSNKLSAHEQTA